MSVETIIIQYVLEWGNLVLLDVYILPIVFIHCG